MIFFPSHTNQADWIEEEEEEEEEPTKQEVKWSKVGKIFSPVFAEGTKFSSSAFSKFFFSLSQRSILHGEKIFISF